MFEKKEVIFSETLGVCRVFEVVKLSAKNNEQVLYYGLRSLYDEKKVSYIPVENHQVQLRPLISYEEAKELEDKDVSELRRQEVYYVLQNHKG
ncbi:MAG: CarD-like/TRCF domain protein [Lachnospiraceae bacterium]